MNFWDDIVSNGEPLYKQIVTKLEDAVRSGEMAPGTALPSLNELAAHLGISRETAKKAYCILRNRKVIEQRQGKGTFVSERDENYQRKVLMLLDGLSQYRKAFIDTFTEAIGPNVNITILLHNQDPQMLSYFLDLSLDKYDSYIVTPHFKLDESTQEAVLAQLRRIPNRKLILADHIMDGLNGNFGAVYQDYESDAAEALKTIMRDLLSYRHLDVFVAKNSLYGGIIQKSLIDFGRTHGISVECHNSIDVDTIHANQLCLLLNSQADQALFEMNHIAEMKNLVIGKDVKIISYNESPICELVFGGLSTMSTDFAQMGKMCAEMVKSGKMEKRKADFRIIRRKTF